MSRVRGFEDPWVSGRMRAHEITIALAKKHRRDIFLTEVKTGPTTVPHKDGLRKIDALAIKPSWTNPCFSGYEVKASRGDFIADTKWRNYLDYCHRFSFACPAGLIKPQELPPDVGLVWVNPDGGWSVRRKALFRPVEVRWEVLYYIVLSRFDPERIPFFSDTRAYMEAYVQGQNERKDLGKRVSAKWLKEQRKVEALLAEAKRKLG